MRSTKFNQRALRDRSCDHRDAGQANADHHEALGHAQANRVARALPAARYFRMLGGVALAPLNR